MAVMGLFHLSLAFRTFNHFVRRCNVEIFLLSDLTLLFCQLLTRERKLTDKENSDSLARPSGILPPSVSK